jgi:capsular polysaccharide transport system permease protein
LPQVFRTIQSVFADLDKHRRIIFALLMRELSTRYGRENIGFLWVIGEPIIFASGVSILWAMIRPPYENGIKIVPFIITGYLPLILVRQVVSYTVGGVKNNHELLFHRMITPLHLLLARIMIEFTGVSLASVVIIMIYNLIGIEVLPKTFADFGYVYAGWFLLAWLSGGLALIMAALAEIFDFVERFVQITTYLLIPLSGAFFMAANMPPKVRAITLSVPFIHEFEMIRRGFFGTSVTTIFDVPYAVTWCVWLTVVGLFLVQFIRSRVSMEG